MKQNEKKSGIKTGLIINFLSLISTVVLFEYYRYIDDWNLLPIIAVSSALFVFLISFYLVYGRTGAWRHYHFCCHAYSCPYHAGISDVVEIQLIAYSEPLMQYECS